MSRDGRWALHLDPRLHHRAAVGSPESAASRHCDLQYSWATTVDVKSMYRHAFRSLTATVTATASHSGNPRRPWPA